MVIPPPQPLKRSTVVENNRRNLYAELDLNTAAFLGDEKVIA
jgi:hypothetical protein